MFQTTNQWGSVFLDFHGSLLSHRILPESSGHVFFHTKMHPDPHHSCAAWAKATPEATPCHRSHCQCHMGHRKKVSLVVQAENGPPVSHWTNMDQLRAAEDTPKQDRVTIGDSPPKFFENLANIIKHRDFLIFTIVFSEIL